MHCDLCRGGSSLRTRLHFGPLNRPGLPTSSPPNHQQPLLLSILILLTLLSIVNVVETKDHKKAKISVENTLITNLMTNYSKYGRPISDVSQPVNVYISFYLTQLMSLEEKQQVLVTFGWLETFWQDDYLTWSPEDYSGLNQLVLSPQLVWLPDFGIENSAKSIYNELFYRRFRVSVTHTGMVNWVPGGKFLTSCQLDITYYPFDDQSCNIDLVDWAYHGLQVKLMNGSATIGLDAYTQSGEWSITTTTASSADQYYESDPGVPFPRVRFNMKLRRKPMFYLINIITPCTMMSLLAVLVFSLPPDSGEKVSLGITVLLSFSVFLLLVAENVPKTSENVPLLGIYLTLIMGMTALSILFCVIVLNLHHEDKNRPVPTWLRYLHRCMSGVMGGNSMTNRLKPLHSLHTLNTHCSCSQDKRTRLHGVYSINGGHTESCGLHRSRGALSRLLDCGATNLSSSTSSTGGGGGGCTSGAYSRRNDPAHPMGVAGIGAPIPIAEAGGEMDEVLKHLRAITDRLRDAEEQETIRAQWKMLARMLDRIFLLVFVMMIVLSTFSLLVIYPLLGRYRLGSTL